jgi:hypothetical protein
MAQGLDIFNSDGDLTYSTSDVTWNQVDFFQVNGGSSVSNSYPFIDNKQVITAQFFIDGPPSTQAATAHTITVSGTTVSVSGGSENVYIVVLAR